MEQIDHTEKGPLARLPQLGGLVYYFPQGHSEQDYTMQLPTEELVLKDLHENTYTFRHIYRGQPKRHLFKLVTHEPTLWSFNEPARSKKVDLNFGSIKCEPAPTGPNLRSS
ncbi:hypothetical protein SAY86_001484 [Trapa natans]|uniref:Uncharacterized protein n=1 Tax=Trapa natans TaxID=22666 RepID=A0AAN7RMF9_TRANT|nr:hypothetical protein SAY86_001484 [Trapa natans]